MNDLERIYDANYDPTQDEIFTHLKFISGYLTQNNIKHWLMYGTLLGAVRQNDIIPYDYDFDLGIMYEDYEKVLLFNEFLNQYNYSLEKTSGVVYCYKNLKQSETRFRVSLKVKFNTNPVADLYIYFKCQDEYLRRYDKEEGILYWPNSVIPFYFIENLNQIRIRDTIFPCPIFPEILVEHWYGQMWNTPIKANSQGGQGHPEYDYYGGYINLKLMFLTDFVKAKNIKINPKFEMKINYIFPKEQFEWIKTNENLV